jgi:hypothetical protein
VNDSKTAVYINLKTTKNVFETRAETVSARKRISGQQMED